MLFILRMVKAQAEILQIEISAPGGCVVMDEDNIAVLTPPL
jgi:hypothetical protein